LTSLAPFLRSSLLHLPEVTRLTSLRRSTRIYSQDQVANFLYLVDEGLVKLTRTNESSNQFILSFRGPNAILGEEALSTQERVYHCEAEAVSASCSVYKIPYQLLSDAITSNEAMSKAFMNYLLCRKLEMAKKVELLCLHDVEYRILHYLAELSWLVKPEADGTPHELPITQLELADLICATRETTSTTLNQLERRGLVKLSRRLLSIPSPAELREAAGEQTKPEPV
jgi:CRP/FNR family transcriptional regulator, cyclic AMP receptor protein